MNAKVKGTAFALFGGACWGLSSVVGKLLFDMRGMNAEWQGLFLVDLSCSALRPFRKKVKFLKYGKKRKRHLA